MNVFGFCDIVWFFMFILFDFVLGFIFWNWWCFVGNKILFFNIIFFSFWCIVVCIIFGRNYFFMRWRGNIIIMWVLVFVWIVFSFGWFCLLFFIFFWYRWWSFRSVCRIRWWGIIIVFIFWWFVIYGRIFFVGFFIILFWM